MSYPHGPYHRVGEPGGPGARVAVMRVELKGPDGGRVPADLFDAGQDATELELLRTVAQALRVKWGRDDLGWWAVIPVALELDG